MREASFRPALLKGLKHYRLKAGVLSEVSDGKSVWNLPLADVDRAAFVDVIFKRTRLTRLDLFSGDVCHSVRLGQPSTDWIANPESREFLALAKDICEDIEKARPGFELTQGEYGRSRMVMFAIGVLMIVAILVFIGIAILANIPTEKFFAGMVPMGIGLVFGGYYAYSYNPWQKPDLLSAAGFARRFERWLEPSDA